MFVTELALELRAHDDEGRRCGIFEKAKMSENLSASQLLDNLPTYEARYRSSICTHAHTDLLTRPQKAEVGQNTVSYSLAHLFGEAAGHANVADGANHDWGVFKL